MQRRFAGERDFVAQFLLPKMIQASKTLDQSNILDFSVEKKINSGFSDLVMERVGKPVLVLEAKFKKKTAKIDRDIEPRDPDVIKQAMNYAVIGGYPYYATCNLKRIILFQLQPGIKIYESEIASFNFLQTPDWAERIIKISLGMIKAEPKQLDDTLVDILLEAYNDLYPQFLTSLRKKIEEKEFLTRFSDWMERQGLRVTDDILRLIASQSTYLEINKFLFYHIVRIIYPDRLAPLKIEEHQDVAKALQKFYDDVLEIDYAPIYEKSIISELPFTRRAEIRILTLLDTLNDFDFSKIESDFIGRIYEKLIPPEERKRLGQFYTPSEIVDIITKLVVTQPNDVILDPGCGSGSFLVRSYHRLRELKSLPAKSRNIAVIFYNKQLLEQIYGIDINQFPAHLSVINLAVQNPRARIDKVNVMVEDFFNIKPGISTLTGFASFTPEGKSSEITLPPYFDVVIGNPPYIRQELVSLPEKRRIKNLIENEYKYKIYLGSSSRRRKKDAVTLKLNSDVYIYFFIHGLKLLKNGGKLGYISSNKWLEVSYGIPFQKFLLNNVKISYVIEFDRAVFSDAEVNTAITILEKENDKKKRENNIVKFIRFKRKLNIDKLISIIIKSRDNKITNDYTLNVIKQKQLDPGKWNVYLRAPPVFHKLLENDNIITFSKIAKIIRAPTTGNNDYFILSKETKDAWDIESIYLKPCLSSPKNIDGMIVKSTDNFLFHVTKNKNDLDGTNALKYIESGEKLYIDIKRGSQRGRRRLPELETLKSRKPYWYSLPLKEASPILFPRLIDTRPIFLKNEVKAHTPHVFYYIYPNDDLNTDVLLAYLNSSIVALFIELLGRSYGGGVLELLVYEIQNLPIINPILIEHKEKDNIVKKYYTLIQKTNIRYKKEAYLNKIKSKDPRMKGILEKEAIEAFNKSIKEEKMAREELDNSLFSILKLSADERTQILNGLHELQEIRRIRSKS